MNSDSLNPFSLADDPSFRAFVHGSDPEAVRYWNEWQARHPDRRTDVEAAARLVEALAAYRPRQLPPDQLEDEIRKVQQLVDLRRPRWQRWVSGPVGRAAAAVLLLVGFVGIWRYSQQAGQPAETPVATQAPRSAPASEAPGAADAVVYRTGFGERRELTLPDGSVVTLNANSELALTPGWADGKREVRLNGEAFFRVRKQQRDGQRVKFAVRAAGVRVEVLGTQFDVSTRHRRVKVVLNEGKIRLNVAKRTLDMLPGDLVEVSEQQAISLHSRIEADKHSSWTEDELVFEETPLSDIATLIEENYGYRVALEDPALASRRLTATLPDSNLDVLLTALERAFSLHIIRQDKTLLIRAARPVNP
ncbi:FecR family protein [Tellurirhabdus rosea]|uniref:FecR family protein n=1 Tax=Tellurirhabdus rosea TaxID=2674997 RepID=UPI002254735A|nr:FecR domain-containing protein [Tellurirhabdus rosea]